jgi:ketosteroid isomerase-like protein
VAAAFTEDGVLVVQEGPSFGRAAIQKFYENLFQKVHFSTMSPLWMKILRMS